MKKPTETRQARWRRARRAQGLCVQCGAPAFARVVKDKIKHASRCPRCSGAEKRAYAKKHKKP